MNKDNSSGVPAESQVSGVGQTASLGRSTSVSSGAAKVFREFKWGLLTLFLLMVVVIGLVYDGGARKKSQQASKPADPLLDVALDGATAAPPVANHDPLLGPVGPVVPDVQNNPGNSIVEFGPVPPIPNAPVNPDRVVPPPTNPINPTTISNGLVGMPPHTPNLSQVVEPPLPPPAPVNRTYKVQSGDTLSRIAQTLKLGKGGVKALMAANKTTLPDPNRLKVGMSLNVPEIAAPKIESGDSKVAMAENAPKTGPVKSDVGGTESEYTVQSGDTLERIARKVFNDGRRWQEIHSWNRDQLPDPARLRVGQVLKLKQVAKSSANKNKVSEAEVPNTSDEKAVVVESPKAEVGRVSKTNVEKHDEPRVEVMSANSSAFAP